IRRYVEHRLALARSSSDEELQEKLDEVQEMHARMQSLVRKAVNEGTPVMVPLVNTLNAVTSNHAARLAAVHDPVPGSIVLLLFLGSVLALVMLGRQQGVSAEWRPGATVAFTALVCMVVWATLDLNQPQRGLITVSQEPLEQLLKGMGK